MSRHKSQIDKQAQIITSQKPEARPRATEEAKEKHEVPESQLRTDILPLGDLLVELSGVLEVEIDQYKECLDLLHQQREYIIAGDSDAVEEIGKKQNTTILKIKALEEARKIIVSEIAQYFHTPVEKITLTKLAELVESPYNQWYIAYQQQIQSLIRELEDLKASNTYLIQHALHYINGVLKIFASVSTMETTYSKEGIPEYNTERGKRITGWG